MNARVEKLARLGLDRSDAEKLVEAGIDAPSKIKTATDGELKAIPGIGAATVRELRERFPRKA